MGKFVYALRLIRPQIGKLVSCGLQHKDIRISKILSLPIWGRVLNLLWRGLHTRSPSAPIWNIIHGIEILLKGISLQQK